jgi:hypothetical protein
MTEVPDFVIAMGKAYRDIEVPFSEADNLVPKFRHNKPQILVTFGYGESLVPVSVEQNQWR